jgi:hypothetical protein
VTGESSPLKVTLNLPVRTFESLTSRSSRLKIGQPTKDLFTWSDYVRAQGKNPVCFPHSVTGHQDANSRSNNGADMRRNKIDSTFQNMQQDGAEGMVTRESHPFEPGPA